MFSSVHCCCNALVHLSKRLLNRDDPYSPNCLERLSEKSLRCLWNSLKRSPLTDFLPPYWPNAWLGALLSPLFGQSQTSHSRKYIDRFLHSLGAMPDTTLGLGRGVHR